MTTYRIMDTTSSHVRTEPYFQLSAAVKKCDELNTIFKDEFQPYVVIEMVAAYVSTQVAKNLNIEDRFSLV